MSSVSLRGGKRTRPLGSLRHVAVPNDSLTQIPKLSTAAKVDDDVRLDERYSGVQGNAMTLPAPKETPCTEEMKLNTPEMSKQPAPEKSPTATSSNVISHEACEKELKEVLDRERDLQDTVAHLRKQIELLTKQVGEKQNVIQMLTTDMKSMEENLQQKFEVEKLKHAESQADLEATRSELQEALSQLEAMKAESKKKIDLMRLDLTQQMTELAAAKDKEITEQDQKLSRLKMQMADALKGNSWERQQQLEELTKDLARVQDECDMLNNKLKIVSKGKPTCGNCAEAVSRSEKLATLVKEREVTIKELKSLCTRFEKQLTQQDQLLKQWTKSTSSNLTMPK